MRQTHSTEAAEILRNDSEALFLDVRSRGEFEAGHPEGARNVPILEPDGSGQMVPNPDFLTVVQALAPGLGGAIVLSCQAGGRSMRACQALEAAGYTDCVNNDGGFGGRGNPATGTIEVPGWAACGLPVSTENGEGVSYASLRQQAGLDPA
jgi:rhodanese-related sulfurtransferase